LLGLLRPPPPKNLLQARDYHGHPIDAADVSGSPLSHRRKMCLPLSDVDKACMRTKTRWPSAFSEHIMCFAVLTYPRPPKCTWLSAVNPKYPIPRDHAPVHSFSVCPWSGGALAWRGGKSEDAEQPPPPFLPRVLTLGSFLCPARFHPPTHASHPTFPQGASDTCLVPDGGA
jgi:hypothetical protein